MIRKNKIVLSIILSIAFLLSTLLFLSTILFDTKQAKAASSVEGFYMSDGAEILIAKDGAPSGIRWTANVSNSCTISNDAEFGIIIDKEPIVAVETNTTEQIIKSTATPTYENGVWTYKCGILYDDLVNALKNEGITDESEIQTQLNKAYATTLYARGYAKVDGEYFYAQEGDTARTLKDVARYCLIINDELVGENQSTFESYAGGQVSITVKAADSKLANVYATSTATGEVTAKLDAGTYDVYVGAKYIGTETLNETGTVSTTLENLSSVTDVGEEYYVDYVKGNSVIRIPFLCVTHTIGTAAEFSTFMSYDTSISADTYVVLTDDIDMNGTHIPNRASASFAGTFNGLGHVVSNLNYGVSGSSENNKGLFGSSKGALIENVAFVNLQQANNSQTSVFSSSFRSVLKNVYIDIKYTNINVGVIRFGWQPEGEAHNVIINVQEGSQSGKFAFGDCFNYEGTNTIENSYVIGDVLFRNETSSAPETRTAYTDFDAFLAAEKTNITKAKGFNDYWTVNENGIKFGSKYIFAKETVKDTLYFTEDSEIELSTLTSDLDGATVQINGSNATVSDGKVSVAINNYTKGTENTLTVMTADGLKYVQPFMCVSVAIGTAAEFSTFMSYNDKISADTYVVLTKDIDMNNTAIYGRTNASFAGTFNGLGHVVSNIKYGANGNGDNKKGLFGYMSGVIENVAFINLQQANGYATNVLSNHLAGKIQNAYIDVSSTNLINGVINFGANEPRGEAHNVIINVRAGSTGAIAGFGNCIAPQWTTNTITNSFVIGNVAFRTYPNNADQDKITDTRTAYANVDAFLTAEKTNITNANGFNEYWTVTKNGIKFGSQYVLCKQVVKETLYFTQDSQIDLTTLSSDLDGATVKINDTTANIVNGKVSIAFSSYTKGNKNTLTLTTADGLSYVQPFMCATNVISSAEEFATFMSYDTAISSDIYVVLTKDIDMEGAVIYGRKNASFAGTFNGLGHVISNLKFAATVVSDPNNYENGIFGTVSGTAIIENVAFVNLQQADTNLSNVLSNSFRGKLKNVYIDITSLALVKGVMNFGCTEPRGEAHNVIINVRAGSTGAIAGFGYCVDAQWGTNKIENSFVIGSGIKFRTYSDSVQEDKITDFREPYADVSTMLSANSDAIETNFNEYWSFDNSGNLYFGTAKIGG